MSRICRVCDETDETKFYPSEKRICKKCKSQYTKDKYVPKRNYFSLRYVTEEEKQLSKELLQNLGYDIEKPIYPQFIWKAYYKYGKILDTDIIRRTYDEDTGEVLFDVKDMDIQNKKKTPYREDYDVPLISIDDEGNMKEYRNLLHATRATDIPKQSIIDVLKNKYQKTRGYRWRYK